MLNFAHVGTTAIQAKLATLKDGLEKKRAEIKLAEAKRLEEE